MIAPPGPHPQWMRLSSRPAEHFLVEYPAWANAGVIPANPRQLEVTEHPTPSPKLIDRAGQIAAGGLLEVGSPAGTVAEQIEDLAVRVRDRNTRHDRSSSYRQ